MVMIITKNVYPYIISHTLICKYGIFFFLNHESLSFVLYFFYSFVRKYLLFETNPKSIKHKLVIVYGQ